MSRAKGIVAIIALFVLVAAFLYPIVFRANPNKNFGREKSQSIFIDYDPKRPGTEQSRPDIKDLPSQALDTR